MDGWMIALALADPGSEENARRLRGELLEATRLYKKARRPSMHSLTHVFLVYSRLDFRWVNGQTARVNTCASHTGGGETMKQTSEGFVAV